MHLSVVLWVCPICLSVWIGGKLEIESFLAYQISDEWLSLETQESGRRIEHPIVLTALRKQEYLAALEASR